MFFCRCVCAWLNKGVQRLGITVVDIYTSENRLKISILIKKENIKEHVAEVIKGILEREIVLQVVIKIILRSALFSMRDRKSALRYFKKLRRSKFIHIQPMHKRIEPFVAGAIRVA